MSFQHSKNLHVNVLLFGLNQVFILSFSIYLHVNVLLFGLNQVFILSFSICDLNGRKFMTSSLQLFQLVIINFGWLFNHLIFNFFVLQEKILSNKTKQGVSIIRIEETFIPHKCEMEMTCHHDPISYGKSVLAFKLIFLGFCCFIFWSFSISSFFISICIILLLDLFIYFPFLHFLFFFFPCKYNQVDKHLKA